MEHGILGNDGRKCIGRIATLHHIVPSFESTFRRHAASPNVSARAAAQALAYGVLSGESSNSPGSTK